MTNDVTRGVQDNLFIGGRLRPAHSVTRIPVIDPATEQAFAAIPDADTVDVDDAVRAATSAFRDSGWAELDPAERAGYLRRLAELIESRGEELGRVVTAQNGMPLANSIAGNGAAAAGYYRYFAGLADELEPETERSGRGARTVVRQEPVGVAALIVPWNGPQGAIAWKLAPALAAGCTAVVKPAPETSLDSYILAELVSQARAVAAPRVLVDSARTGDVLDWLVAPIVLGASIVLCANLDPTRVDARLTSEHAVRWP